MSTNASTAHLDRARFARILREHPDLCDGGVGLPRAHRTARQAQDEFNRDRTALESRCADVTEVAGWLRDNVRPLKHPSRSGFSYWLKHVVERALGRYVSNGELIAAALLVGYPMRRIEDSLNAEFGMSKRDLETIKTKHPM